MTETFETLLTDVKRSRAIDENTRQLVFTLSKIIDEERQLQDVVDREGMTYHVTGDKGQNYIKVRPEYDQLQKLRDKKRAYIAAIGISEGEAENPDFA
jgi:hypothetical protein